MEKSGLFKQKVKSVDFWLGNVRYIVFVALIIFFAAMSPKFLAWRNVSQLLLTTVPYAIAVIGTTFVMLTAGIDLSIGATILVTGSVAVYVGNTGAPFVVSLLAAMVAGFICGTINGVLVAKFNIVPFLATLATMSFYKGLILQFGAQGYIILRNMDYMMLITNTRILGIHVVVYILAIIIVLTQLLLKRTSFGWHLYAVGNNPTAAAKIGINVSNIKYWAYAISGILVGLCGFIQVCMVGAVSTGFGDGWEFTIISATVLGGVSLSGGKGNIFPGAIVGILIFMIIENGMTVIAANSYFFMVVRGIVIFLAVIIDSIRNKGDLR